MATSTSKSDNNDEIEKPPWWKHRAMMWGLLLWLPCFGICLIGKCNQPPGSDSSGNDAAFFNQAGQDLYAAGKSEDYDAFVNTVNFKDAQGLDELLASGRVFRVPSGTKVRPLERRFGVRRVRILEGEHEGKTAWTASEFIIDR